MWTPQTKTRTLMMSSPSYMLSRYNSSFAFSEDFVVKKARCVGQSVVVAQEHTSNRLFANSSQKENQTSRGSSAKKTVTFIFVIIVNHLSAIILRRLCVFGRFAAVWFFTVPIHIHSSTPLLPTLNQTAS